MFDRILLLNIITRMSKSALIGVPSFDESESPIWITYLQTHLDGAHVYDDHVALFR